MNDDAPGCWVAYYTDHSGLAIFPTEIEALRYAITRSMDVKFSQWGEFW